jgi:hypothetical protein
MDASLVRGRLSLSLVATFIGLLAVLHFLKPEFNSGHLISESQLGRFGSMMSLAFWSFGIGAMLLAQVIRTHLSIRSATCGGRPHWRGSASSRSWVPRPSSSADMEGPSVNRVLHGSDPLIHGVVVLKAPARTR